MEQRIPKEFAISQVREMEYQFADMYFTFVSELVKRYGDEEAMKTVTAVLFQRAKERANDMIQKANEEGKANKK